MPFLGPRLPRRPRIPTQLEDSKFYAASPQKDLMEKNRILLKDGSGSWRKIVDIACRVSKKGADIYLLLPQNFGILTGEERHAEHKKILVTGAKPTLLIGSHFHLRYPPTGNVHLVLKNTQGETIKSLYQQYEPLESLTPGKRFFRMVPKKLEHYPAYKGVEENDWRIEAPAGLQDFFTNQPVCLSFWIGKGEEGEIESKLAAIRSLEMIETKRYVEVLAGGADRFQIFIVISRPPELTEFPEHMRLFLYESGTALKLKSEE